MQRGDVKKTYASTKKLQTSDWIQIQSTSINKGINKFIDWYLKVIIISKLLIYIPYQEFL